MPLGSVASRLARRAQGRCALPVVAMLTFAFTFAAPVVGTANVACADTRSHAALVVDSGPRELELCVAIPSGSTSGIDLIELASAQYGLDYRLGFGGKAVCRLAGIGTDGGDCFGDYPDFWGYWRGEGQGSWSWSSTGAADTVVHPGDVEGWSWGSGQDGSTHPPPERATISSVCGAQTPSPTPTAKPTPEPTPPHEHRHQGPSSASQPESGDDRSGGDEPSGGDGGTATGGSEQGRGGSSSSASEHEASSDRERPSSPHDGGLGGSDRSLAPPAGTPAPATPGSEPVSVLTLAKGGTRDAGSPFTAVVIALLVASLGGIGWTLLRRRRPRED